MSLWTPDGERPVDRGGESGPQSGPTPMADDLSPEQEAEAQRIAAEMAQVREQLSSVPAAVVVANHAMGCYELAAIHLSAQPPKLEEAQLAIDAFGSLTELLKGKLGRDEATLEDALNQIRMAYVQIKGSQGAGAGEATSDSAPEES